MPCPALLFKMEQQQRKKRLVFITRKWGITFALAKLNFEGRFLPWNQKLQRTRFAEAIRTCVEQIFRFRNASKLVLWKVRRGQKTSGRWNKNLDLFPRWNFKPFYTHEYGRWLGILVSWKSTFLMECVVCWTEINFLYTTFFPLFSKGGASALFFAL